MGRASCGLIVALMLMVADAPAQETSWSIGINANFTTGSQLFPNANAGSAMERARYFPIEDIPGIGLDLRYRFPETYLSLGLSADYISASVKGRLAGSVSAPVEDGYRVIPVELTGYFLIPLSGSTFGIYMGGGGGIYFGRRTFSIAGVEAVPLGNARGYGIHVLGGVRYRLTEWFSLNGEMKFRDVQFQAVNAFQVSYITYEGSAITVGRDPIKSRVHTDGMVFQVGAAFTF